ncbi:MAG: DUF4268 domain-containing protein [Verrucomicrobiota bacterium]
MNDEMEFSEIEKVDPRNYWNHEALDFTPWLADNLDKLGQAIGLDLALIEREASVGSFSLDILAKDLGTNSSVIIENQLAVTDHDHLGKLLTYASGVDAEVIVWLATSIREEHRQALDWLNQRTDEKTDFFGVVVEVVTIGDSKPALQFKVIVSPNEWQKEKKASSSVITEKADKYRQYFQILIDELREKHHFTRAQKASPVNWYSFASGSRLFVYGHNFATRNRVRTEVYIDSGDSEENDAFFEKLNEQKDIIEKELGTHLDWERLENRRASRIVLYRKGSIEDSSEVLEEIREWAIKYLIKFKEVFGKYV